MNDEPGPRFGLTGGQIFVLARGAPRGKSGNFPRNHTEISGVISGARARSVLPGGEVELSWGRARPGDVQLFLALESESIFRSVGATYRTRDTGRRGDLLTLTHKGGQGNRTATCKP